MNIGRFKQRLLEKERELQADLARFEAEARASGEPEVGDPTDEATSAELLATASAESSLEHRSLLLVLDALERIERGTFGTCIDCGQAIEPARLEAVPWTPYCRDDQEKHDSETVVGADAGEL